MDLDTFELVVMATLVVGFCVVCVRLSELHAQLRRLERSMCGHSETDLAMLAEIGMLVKSGKSVRAIKLYRRHFGATLAEAAREIEKIKRATASD